jgi:phosphohistidine phosphatase
MKTLHLLRHAKSSWNHPQVCDRDRSLSKRGKQDALRMGASLAQRITPVSIHASPARRAQLTLRGLCRGWPAMENLSHHTRESLYTFSTDDLFAWITQQKDTFDTLFILSHNPALTELTNVLVGEPCVENIPTAGYVELALNLDYWRNLRQGCAVLEYSLFPRQLRD